MSVVVPEINNIPFRNVLIVENRPEDTKDLEKDLRERGLCVISVNNSTNAEEILKQRPELDIIILDWYLNEEDSMESKVLLGEIKDYVFAPVIIYTKQGTIGPEDYIKERNLDRITIVLDKNELTGDLVFGRITRWIEENAEIRIFLKWAFEVEKTLNPVLWEVHDIEISGLRALLEMMKPSEGAAHMRLGYDLAGLFLKALSRRMNHNRGFFSSILPDIAKITGAVTPESTPESNENKVEVAPELKVSKRFHCYERYISPPVSEPFWTGDIIKKSGDEYFILVTPSCDLCHLKIDNVLLLKTVPFNKYVTDDHLNNHQIKEILKNNNTHFHYLPYISEPSDGLLCLFEHINSMEIDTFKAEINSKRFERIATIDSPFIENLIQRMNAYLMRLGVRDIEKDEITRILPKLNPNQGPAGAKDMPLV